MRLRAITFHDIRMVRARKQRLRVEFVEWSGHLAEIVSKCLGTPKAKRDDEEEVKKTERINQCKQGMLMNRYRTPLGHGLQHVQHLDPLAPTAQSKRHRTQAWRHLKPQGLLVSKPHQKL